jgi:type I restriction enzyme S subunit
LNLGIIKDTQINKPPVELQNQFATIVEKVEALKEKYQNSLNDLETLYGALSQKAFKGELDLSRIPIPVAVKPKDISMDVPQVEKPDLAVQDEPVKTLETREQILHRLFHGFISDAKTGALSLDDFWRTAEEAFKALLDEEASPLGAADYDRVRDWLFDLLAKGSVVQVFNEEKNRMEIRSVS